MVLRMIQTPPAERTVAPYAPGDYEHYVDGVHNYQSRANVDPGSDFEINFN